MRCLYVIIIFSLNAQQLQAQLQDRNWAFGYGAGVNFNDTSNIDIFSTETYNLEVAASISDRTGNLLFYVGYNISSVGLNIYDRNNNITSNGDSVKSNPSVTNGALILPEPGNDSLYILLHIDIDFQNYPGYNLFYSIIELENSGSLLVTKKNKAILQEPLVERLSAVRHANGKDWWLLVQAQQSNELPCPNRYYTYLINKNLIQLHSTQDIGSFLCDDSSYWGEMTFNKQGTQLAVAIGSMGVVDLFDFDRCNGILSNHVVVDNEASLKPYGCEFSPNGRNLYISSGGDVQTGELFQYNLSDFSRTRIWVDTIGAQAGQLQIAPDNRIYFAINWWVDPVHRNFLGVINAPDSAGLACNFQPFGFYLGDSARTNFGLPNMPNFNLGPLTIYQANAGDDKLLCKEDSITGAYIGSLEVDGVQYSWLPIEGLDNANIAMPFANPSQTTMYVVTLTDTSIQYSCETRNDTVWVIIEDCYPESNYTFPSAFTPNNDGINDFFGIIANNTGLIEFRIYNRWGQVIHDAPTTWDGTYKGKEQPMGTFIYYAIIQIENGERRKISGAVSLLR